MTPAVPRPGDTLSFPADSSLFNNRFESYKLAPLPRGDDAVISTPLPTPFVLPETPPHARLSYQQVADRARHNHLKAGPDGELLFIDGTGAVTAIEVDPTSAAVRLHPLLIVPLASDATTPEYPDAHPVAPREWLISDGRGRIYLLTIEKSPLAWSANLRPAAHVAEEGHPIPFRCLAVRPAPTGGAMMLYATSSRTGQSQPDSAPEEDLTAGTFEVRMPRRSRTTFYIQLAHLENAADGGASDLPLQSLWRATSDELPAFVHYDAALQRFVIGSGSPVKIAHEGAIVRETSPSLQGPPDDATSSQPQSDPVGTSPDRRRPPPFSWTQDGDSVTVAFPIPSDTPTSSIRLTLSRQYVTLHVASAAAALAPAAALSPIVPRLSHKKLWDLIDPNTSVWTFDREAEGRNSTFGLLTLHLEKGHHGTRWADVFETVPRGGDTASSSRFQELDPEEDYENVPETLDASELAAISEQMEQWAQSVLQTGPSALAQSAEGLGSGIPTSLTGDEIDVEVDGDTGKAFVVTWIENALTPTPQTVCPHESVPYSLLSTSFPAPDNLDTSDITVQHDVDGLLFQAPTTAAEYRWRHTSTFPALAFVLATKRDTRFVYHLDRRACFAFDSPALLPGPARTRPFGGAGNLFVYVSPDESKAKQGIQHVVRVGSPSSGGLLGVISTRLASGEPVIIALCEHEVVTLRVFG